METVRPLLFPNQQLSSLKLDCGRLGNSAIDVLARPSLREISLHNCRDFSGDLISEIGRKCKDLRSVCVCCLLMHLLYQKSSHSSDELVILAC